MQKAKQLFLIALLSLIGFSSQQATAKDFGLGLKIGDPTGLTFKFWLDGTNALVADIGGSYFGSPRINLDYLWHFNSFNTKTLNLYAGVGGVLGFGEGNGWVYKNEKFHRDELGIGANVLFGLNFLPKNTPLEIFVEIEALVGIVPDFASGYSGSVGIRVYP